MLKVKEVIVLKDYELLQLFKSCEYPEKAQVEIKRVRSSEPSRRVRSARGNMSGSYPSAKMGFTFQFESHEDELPFIYQLEHDKDVLEYYDQPPFIKLSYMALDKSGKEKHIAFNYTPDFFVIKKDSAGWVECKTEEELERLAEDHPERYRRGDDGQWHCPPGDEYAKPFGFFFQVVSSASINQIFKRNIVYLDQYLCNENCFVNHDTAKQVLDIVQEEPGITLEDLRQRADKASSDDINILIARGLLYFNLYTAPLAEPRHARLYRDEDAADAFSVMFETPFRPLAVNAGTIRVAPETIVLWDNKPWKIVNLGETKVTLMSEDERQAVAELLYERFYGLINRGALVSLKSEVQVAMVVGKARGLLLGASREDLRVANYRHGVVMSVLQKEASASDFAESERTVWNWVSMYRRAQKLLGNGYLGLLPKTKDRGNRGRKIREDTLKLIEEFITTDYQNLKQMNKAAVYGKFEAKCEESHIPKASYKIFIREIEMRSGYGQTKKRQGRKAAYDQKPWFWELEYTTPRHGDRPWEVGHIDHTQLEIELIHSETKKNLGRPWVTFLTDAYSRRILAIYLTFDKPSYRSCMMVLRECVRRHNRLPQIMVYDGALNFTAPISSRYSRAITAHAKCGPEVSRDLALSASAYLVR
jgi:putative transposase